MWLNILGLLVSVLQKYVHSTNAVRWADHYTIPAHLSHLPRKLTQVPVLQTHLIRYLLQNLSRVSE